MASKFKGLLRGLRYLTQLFGDKGKKEEVEEIQIGLPTDVKHVAHIGLDGPTAAAPTWMDGFKGGQPGSQQQGSQQAAPLPVPAAKTPVNSVKTPGDSKNSKDSKNRRKLIPKSRNGSSESNATDSPSRESSDGSNKHARRHRSSDPTSESPSSKGHSRKSRSSNLGSDSATTGSKHRIRRKKKSSMDGSERSSTKGDSITDISLPDLNENGHHRKNSDC